MVDGLVVSCDWLAYSCKLGRLHDIDELHLPSGWTALKMSQTAVWAQRWYIMDVDGNKVATFLCEPRSPKISADRGLVEIANRYLYDDNLEAVANAVLDIWPMAVDGVNRVDLCCDFEMTPERWQVVRALEDGSATLKGVHNNNVWRSQQSRKQTPHQLSWGGKESTFHWKLYNKYKELHEGGLDASKPYIEDLWKRSGLNVKSVWRLEVSVTGCNSLLTLADDKKFPVFEWYRQRERLFSSLYTSKFEVRLQLGYKNNRNNPRLFFLDVNEEKMLKCRGTSDSERTSDCERRVICKMWEEFTDAEVGCNRDLQLSIAEFLADRFQQERAINYVSMRYGIPTKDIIQRVTCCLQNAPRWLDAERQSNPREVLRG